MNAFKLAKQPMSHPSEEFGQK